MPTRKRDEKTKKKISQKKSSKVGKTLAKETCVRKRRLGSFTVCLRYGAGFNSLPTPLPAQQSPEKTSNNNRR